MSCPPRLAIDHFASCAGLAMNLHRSWENAIREAQVVVENMFSVFGSFLDVQALGSAFDPKNLPINWNQGSLESGVTDCAARLSEMSDIVLRIRIPVSDDSVDRLSTTALAGNIQCGIRHSDEVFFVCIGLCSCIRLGSL